MTGIDINTQMFKEGLYSYDEAISILSSQGKFHIKLGLERVNSILELLGNPQDNLKVIHVAGTNGKGSTCAMLASILSESGYKTGLYTSPHLIDYTERIKLGGQDISQKDFARLVGMIVELSNLHDIHLTEFEILTILAFVYFHEHNVDFVVLETGLGGRLDATNVVKKPIITIITTIDIDHVDRLGNTIEQIAFEKAGIVKNNIPVVTLKNNNGIDIIAKTSQEKQSPLILADQSRYIYENNKVIIGNTEYSLPLLGLHQVNNLFLALKTVNVLEDQGFVISQVKSGIEKVSWPGRLQYIEDKNLLLDGAHNLSGAVSLRASLDSYFSDKKIIWIYSSLNTKDYKSISEALFKVDDVVIFTKSSSQNAVDPEILKENYLLKSINKKIYSTHNLKKSLNLAYSFIQDNHTSNPYVIAVSGSFYIVGEALKILKTDWQF